MMLPGNAYIESVVWKAGSSGFAKYLWIREFFGRGEKPGCRSAARQLRVKGIKRKNPQD